MTIKERLTALEGKIFYIEKLLYIVMGIAGANLGVGVFT